MEKALGLLFGPKGASITVPGCHNPQTHSFTQGMLVEVEELKKQIEDVPMQDGVTFSGGDPMFQVKPCLELAKFCKEKDLNIWCYTGFTFEQLQQKAKQDPTLQEFLETIDVLVDGKFVEQEKSLNLYFKGSRNQRILDMKESLASQQPVEIEKYKQERGFDHSTYGRKEKMYI